MPINPAKAMLKQGKTALLICDIHAKSSKVTFEFDKMVSNTARLINACKFLNVPTIVTEQIPHVLGPTASELDISSAKGPFAKAQFSMCTPEVNEALSKICSGNPPDSVLLVGQDAHICVENTAIDLRSKGYEVHVVADCVSARTQEDRLFAFERMRDIGCIIATSENAACKLLTGADHAQMKNVFKMFKVPADHLGSGTQSKL